MTDAGQVSTLARLNVTQAAKAVKKARSTLNRDIELGKVSVTRNGKGQPFIDIAELERVYGNVDIRTVSEAPKIGQETVAEPVSNGHIETLKNANSDSLLRQENEFLREKLAHLERMGETERRQFSDQIEDLRGERDRLLKVIEEQAGSFRLLTDQRQPVETPAATAGRGFWSRFSRRSRSA
jgi:hypothetical protein